MSEAHAPPNKNAEKDTSNCINSAFLLLFRVFCLFRTLKTGLAIKRVGLSVEFSSFDEHAFFAFVKIYLAKEKIVLKILGKCDIIII